MKILFWIVYFISLWFSNYMYIPGVSLLPAQECSSILSGWKEEKALICLAYASKCQAH